MREGRPTSKRLCCPVAQSMIFLEPCVICYEAFLYIKWKFIPSRSRIRCVLTLPPLGFSRWQPLSKVKWVKYMIRIFTRLIFDLEKYWLLENAKREGISFQLMYRNAFDYNKQCRVPSLCYQTIMTTFTFYFKWLHFIFELTTKFNLIKQKVIKIFQKIFQKNKNLDMADFTKTWHFFPWWALLAIVT